MSQCTELIPEETFFFFWLRLAFRSEHRSNSNAAERSMGLAKGTENRTVAIHCTSWAEPSNSNFSHCNSASNLQKSFLEHSSVVCFINYWLVSLLIQLFSSKFESSGSQLKTQAEIASPSHQLFKTSSQLSVTTENQIILQISGQGKAQSFCGSLSRPNNINNFHVTQSILKSTFFLLEKNQILIGNFTFYFIIFFFFSLQCQHQKIL